MLARSLSFARRDDRRVLAGVAGGFADQHGIDATVVRGVLVVLTFAAGLGLLLYAFGALVSEPAGAALPPRHPTDARRVVSVVCVGLGMLLVVRSTGVWLGDALMVPLAVVIAGIVVLGLIRPDLHDRSDDSHWSELASGPRARTRLFAGAALVAVGLVIVGTRGGVSSNVRTGVLATAFTVLGIAVLLGPWLAGMARSAAEDRRQRIRLNEREAMAAHLHDSVLQTLALIQRTAGDPRRTVTLARQQERDLREWLYGTTDAVSGSLTSAMRAMVSDVEATYDITIELVMVGDADLTDTHAGLVAAAREACVNVAKHSGATSAAVYVEVGPTELECWVRDRGRGFDQADAALRRTERRGITDSIDARLERLGGRSHIESVPDVGTEVHLAVPVSAVSQDAVR
ncbi:MAG: PspC domain-containing protein [Actinomycetota bacterium]